MSSQSQSCHTIQSSPDQFSAAAESIAGSDHLLAEILHRLPAKSLMRFKSVSKKWLSLITDHHFSLLWQHHHHPVSRISGLFLSKNYDSQTQISCIDFTGNHRNDSLTRFPNFGNCGDIVNSNAISSCNGLLLCCIVGLFDDHPKCKTNYHVYNPTTKQFKTLPWVCETDYIDGMSLAFDHSSKSPYYKVVTLQRRKDQFYQIHVYSSGSGVWKRSGEPFKAPFTANFQNGVFWNGAINWLNYNSYSLLCFDIDEERLREIPLPHAQSPRKAFRHFGQCKGHLQLIEFNGYSKIEIDVFEMERDYSKWFLKYRVDLRNVDPAFQEIMAYNNPTSHNFTFSVLSLVHEEWEEDTCLVLYLGGNIISYNLNDESSKKLYGLPRQSSSLPSLQRLGHLYVHKYMETIFHV